MPNKQLRNELSRFSNKTEQPLRLYSGALGIYIGGKQYVDVPNRPGFVYVRLSSNISELIQAHNQVVSPVYDLPVLLTKTKTYYEVFGRDVEQWANYDTSSSSFLPKHGFQHEFDPDNGGGGDLVFVHGEQFYPLMGFPSGTDGAGNILIAPYRYYANNDWHYAGNTGTPDLLQYKPTGSANAVLLLVGLTVNTGNPFVKIGTEFDASITGAAALTDYVPTSLTVSNEIPGTIVRLVTGTEIIDWSNIYDARQYMGILQAGTNTFLGLIDTPSSYTGQADKLVAVNSGESALEFRTNTGTSGATTFLALTDTPSSYLGQGSKFVAVKSTADGLEFVDSPGGGGGALSIYDDSIFVATGTSISFDSGLTAVATGTTIYVSNPGAITPALQLIQSQYIDVIQHDITFSNIPQTFTNLVFVGKIKSTRTSSDQMGIRWNGHSGTSYHYVRSEIMTSLATTNATGTSAQSLNLPGDTTPTPPVWGWLAFKVEFVGYSISGTVKSFHAQSDNMYGLTSSLRGMDFGAGWLPDFLENITEIGFISGNNFNFVSGSFISLYGMV